MLDKNPEILEAVHRDLQKLSQGGRGGREGDFTSENILRALVVQHREGLAFRDAVIRIGGDGFLQDFLRMRKKAVMDYSFLDKCFLAIRPETWRRINQALAHYGVRQGMVDPTVIRTDTTVVESNIHWPTDSSLLWDTWRVASRLLKRARKLAPQNVPYRFHDRKIKRLHLFITRYMPRMNTIVDNAHRAQVQKETVKAHERVFSLFERHTELIKRGRRQKPVEFGHKVLLCQTAEKFISDYEVYEKQQADCELTEPVIERHKKLFGHRPKVLAADKGFCPAEEKFQALAQMVETLAIPRRMRDFVDKVLAHWQAFRAGIEGTISGLKRAFRLVRCFFQGFRSFSAAVGLGVFCHNLIVLADATSD